MATGEEAAALDFSAPKVAANGESAGVVETKEQTWSVAEAANLSRLRGTMTGDLGEVHVSSDEEEGEEEEEDEVNLNGEVRNGKANDTTDRKPMDGGKVSIPCYLMIYQGGSFME